MDTNENNSEVSKSDKKNLERCGVCLENKNESQFLTFKCLHFMCKTCYEQLRDNTKCFYCRQIMIDVDMVKKISKLSELYAIFMVADLFYIAFIFIIIGVHSDTLNIVSFVELLYCAFLVAVWFTRRTIDVALVCDIIMVMIKIIWIIFVVECESVWWKILVLSISKVIILFIIAVLKHYKRMAGPQYFKGIIKSDRSEV